MLILHTSKDYPWDLLIEIVNARRTGNWTCLNSKAKSVGISGILGIGKPSPLNFPMIIVASIKFFIIFLTASLVLLHNFG